jgi:hypothetical protein
MFHELQLHMKNKSVSSIAPATRKFRLDDKMQKFYRAGSAPTREQAKDAITCWKAKQDNAEDFHFRIVENVHGRTRKDPASDTKPRPASGYLIFAHGPHAKDLKLRRPRAAMIMETEPGEKSNAAIMPAIQELINKIFLARTEELAERYEHQLAGIVNPGEYGFDSVQDLLYIDKGIKALNRMGYTVPRANEAKKPTHGKGPMTERDIRITDKNEGGGSSRVIDIKVDKQSGTIKEVTKTSTQKEKAPNTNWFMGKSNPKFKADVKNEIDKA